MLSAADLQSMREALRESLPDTVTIQRLTRTSDGMGGFNETWTTLASVPGRVSPEPRLPREGVIAEIPQERVRWLITLPAATDVRVTDRLVFGSRTFEIVGVLAPRSYEIATQVIAVERQV